MAVFVYLRFSLADMADLRDFEEDMRAMAQLAEAHPGYLWSEMARSMDEPSMFVVLSEWDSIDDVRSWEHDPVHVDVQHKWTPQFREPLLHRRFTPRERPV